MAMAMGSIATILLFAATCLIGASMATISPDPREFFDSKIKGNLTRITWAHAVNSLAQLHKALRDDDVMCLEADVTMGTMKGSSNETARPIMAHPPLTESDLSLEHFLNSTIESGTRGIKLDFKSIEAFNGSLPLLRKFHDRITIPLFLNADILLGPVEADGTPVNADQFLTQAKEVFPESILSLGWQTSYGVLDAQYTGSYTEKHVRDMINALSRNKITQSVTYAVRGALAAANITVMEELVNRTVANKATLTIWSGYGDFVDREKLSNLIKKVGVERVYVDVPEIVWRGLDIAAGSSTSLASAVILAIGVVVSTFGLTNFI